MGRQYDFRDEPLGLMKRRTPPPPRPPAGLLPPPAPASPAPVATLAAVLGTILVAIGFVIELQSVSVLTGPGTLYIGAAVAAGGIVLLLALTRSLWLKIVCGVVVALCIVNCVVTAHNLDERRAQIARELP